MTFTPEGFWEDLIEDLADPEFREAFYDNTVVFMQEFHEEKLEEEMAYASYEDTYRRTHDEWKDATGRKFWVHKRTVDCDIDGCAIHNPSYHPLSDAKQFMREDKGYLIERICEHGIGHPDPDSASFMARNGWGKGIWIHGCDGCCQESYKPPCHCGCEAGSHMGKPTGCLLHGFHEYSTEAPQVKKGWGPSPEDFDRKLYKGMTPDMFGYEGDY